MKQESSPFRERRFKWLQKAQQFRTPALSEDYWLYMQQNPSYTTWAGYAFENVCLKFVEKIVKALNLSAIDNQLTLDVLFD